MGACISGVDDIQHGIWRNRNSFMMMNDHDLLFFRFSTYNEYNTSSELGSMIHNTYLPYFFIVITVKADF